MNEIPLIWTSKGNLPVDSLRYEHGWSDTEDYTAFEERWFLGDELVKNNRHMLTKKALTMGGEQAVMA
jgi:hypothetical protein